MAPLIQSLFASQRRRFAACALLVLAAFAAPVSGADLRSSQQEVEAVFLLNLTRFIRWPETAFKSDDAPLVMGFLPDDPIGTLLIEATKDEMAGKHPIAIRRIRSFIDLEGCHVIYFARADTSDVAQMITALRMKPVLTVSNSDGFLRLGGHVRMYNRSGQVKLRLDVNNLKRAELSASAPLLRVVEVVGN